MIYDYETTYIISKINILVKIIIFKKIANYAESLPWYNNLKTQMIAY